MNYKTEQLLPLTDNSKHNAIIGTRHSISQLLNSLESLMNNMIDSILHNPLFSTLEATWTGIQRQLLLANNSPNVLVKLFQLSQSELANYVKNRSLTHDHIHHVIFDQEFNMAGGHPYSLLIADFYFSYKDDDMDSLSYLSKLAAQAFCPVITAASPSLLNLQHWHELRNQSSIHYLTQMDTHIKWRQLREQPQSQFLFLTAPAFLGRHIYHRAEASFKYSHQEHIETDADYCWVNSAYAQSQCIMDAFLKYGWCTAIRGKENGGLISQLPLTHTLHATQALLSDSEEHELSKLGIITLCHYKNTDYAVIFASDSVFQPPNYDTEEATQNAKIASRLPYIIATSRFAHYLKVMARDKIGSFLEKNDLEQWLNRWISQYVNSNAGSKSSLKARFPLAAARVSLEENPESPGHYHAVIHMKPWLLLEELSASLRLVTSLPKGKNS